MNLDFSAAVLLHSRKTVDRDSLGSVSGFRKCTLSSMSLYHENLIWKTVVSQRVYFIIKKKIVNILNSSAEMKSYLLSWFIGFWRLRKSFIFHPYEEHFPFHLLLANLLLRIQVYARYGKSVITSQCLCLNMSLSVKKEKECQLTIKLLIIESENQFVSRNEGFKINIVYSLCNLNLQHYKVTLLLYPVFTQALCQEFKTQVHHQKH